MPKTDYKISKEMFDELRSDTVTKKRYDAILSDISTRTDRILRKISTHVEWWDFDNSDWDAADSNGFFDPDRYREEIRVIGEFKVADPYQEGFPTRWLWEDFEDEIAKEIEDYQSRLLKEKEKKSLARQARKEKLAVLQESIRTKLTKEELKAISFKK